MIVLFYARNLSSSLQYLFINLLKLNFIQSLWKKTPLIESSYLRTIKMSNVNPNEYLSVLFLVFSNNSYLQRNLKKIIFRLFRKSVIWKNETRQNECLQGKVHKYISFYLKI